MSIYLKYSLIYPTVISSLALYSPILIIIIIFNSSSVIYWQLCFYWWLMY